MSISSLAAFRPLPEFDFLRPRGARVGAARGCSRGAAGVAAALCIVKNAPSVDCTRSFDAIHGEWLIGALKIWTSGFTERKIHVAKKK